MSDTSISELALDFSGIVLNQNQSPSPGNSVVVNDDLWRYQDFFLPKDYIRGVEDEQFIPPLSGFHINVSIEEGYESTASLDWTLEYFSFGVGWLSLSNGTAIGAPTSGDNVWMEIYFPDPVDIPAVILSDRFRFGIRATSVFDAPLNIPAIYDAVNHTVVIESKRYENIVLSEGSITPLHVNTADGFLTYDASTNSALFSYQQGIQSIWFSTPNPLINESCKFYESDGTTPVEANGQNNLSVLFRILALTADEGVDALGNKYRSTLQTLPASNIGPGGISNSYWLSKPNPSRFAVESMYFDMRDNLGDEVTLDGLLIDPITAGMWINIYFSSEGDAGMSESDWENKLWTRVNQSWKISKRENISFPSPVVAKYVKIEFSHLQAKHYSAGQFARPVQYKKHPKWVLDYFIIRLEDSIAETNKMTSNRVQVVYSALDLAYNYYLDDLDQSPDGPIETDPVIQSQLTSFLTTNNDPSDQIDANMINQISFAIKPYTQGILANSKDTLLATILTNNASVANTDEQVEQPTTSTVNQSALESLTGQPVAFENDYPVMYFFIQCRHQYREVMANFSYDKAYFAGVREVAFLRNQYTSTSDESTYIELGADLVNIQRNDFTTGAFAKSGESVGDLGASYFTISDGTTIPADYPNISDEDPNDLYPNGFYPGEDVIPNG